MSALILAGDIDGFFLADREKIRFEGGVEIVPLLRLEGEKMKKLLIRIGLVRLFDDRKTDCLRDIDP